MSVITGVFGRAVRFLNQPLVKEGVKNIAGKMTFVFGILESYDLYQVLRGRNIVAFTHVNSHKWILSLSGLKDEQGLKVLNTPANETFLTNVQVRMMALFNTTTSRPILHVCNQFFARRV